MKSYVIPVVVLTLLIGIVTGSTTQLVDAITRDEINTLEQIERDFVERDKELDKFLVDNLKETQKFEDELKTQKTELKQLENDEGVSWESIKLVIEKEDEIKQSEINVKDSKSNRIELLNEKSDILVQLRDLQDTINDSRIELKSETFFANVPDFDASSLKKAIGIQLSNSCLTAIKENITSTCPTYEELSQLDSSIISVSGNFTDKGGYFHRDVPEFKNSWRWYDHDDTPRIFVDPPQGMAERISTITIENNFGIYFLAGDHKLENGTSSYHENRFIDNCRNATLNAEGWLESLPTTIYLMRIGCPDLENLDIKYTQYNSTEINLAESNDWKYKNWIADTKEKCKIICKEY